MKSHHFLAASLLATAALTSGCSDQGAPQAGSPIITQPSNPPTLRSFINNLITMVTGSACDTALPADGNSQSFTASEEAVDANTVTPGCTS